MEMNVSVVNIMVGWGVRNEILKHACRIHRFLKYWMGRFGNEPVKRKSKYSSLYGN